MKNLKELLLSGFMSLSKAEQEVFKNMLDEQKNDIQHEQQVRKQEIKLISRKRFYEILDKADDYFTHKGKEKLSLLMEQRGFEEGEVAFSNKNDNGIFKFKTNNGIFRFANLARVKNVGNQKEIWFYINTHEHPSVAANYNRLSNLSKFEITENRKRYSYNILNFIDRTRSNDYEIILKFRAEVIEDGVKRQYDEEEERIMSKKDLINKADTHILGRGDFLL